METWILLAQNLGLCFAGLLAYCLLAVRNHLGDFSWKIFKDENKNFLIWASLCQLLYAILMSTFPAIEELLSRRLIASLEGLLNMDLKIPQELTSIVVYLTLTWQLSRIANNSVKNKIGPKKEPAKSKSE